MTVAVVGVGVIGLSTAITLQDNNFPVTVYAAQAPSASTSMVAGATWFPYQVDPPELATRWARASRGVFDRLAARGEAGVRIRECHQLWRGQVGTPWWAAAVPDLHRLPAAALPPGFTDSYAFRQPVIDMRRYLPYLEHRFTSGGGVIEHARFGSLTEVPGDLVVNCTGLGAGVLAGDRSVYPVRGDVVRVANPGVYRVLADFDRPGGESYLIPHPDSVILGGTATADSWNTTPDPLVAQQIRLRCAELDPRVGEAEILEHLVGLRPARTTGVRLDCRTLENGTPCVHNYGHGGAGVTLSWGCALDVMEVVKNA